MYKKVLVTSGIVSSLLFSGAATTFAQSTSDQMKDSRPMHRMKTAEKRTLGGERKPGFGKKRGMMLMQMAPEVLQAHANVLGITVDELKTALKNRETLKSIIESKGFTREVFHQKVNEQIKQMIAEGKIIGAQAEILQKMLDRELEHRSKTI